MLIAQKRPTKVNLGIQMFKNRKKKWDEMKAYQRWSILQIQQAEKRGHKLQQWWTVRGQLAHNLAVLDLLAHMGGFEVLPPFSFYKKSKEGSVWLLEYVLILQGWMEILTSVSIPAISNLKHSKNMVGSMDYPLRDPTHMVQQWKKGGSGCSFSH